MNIRKIIFIFFIFTACASSRDGYTDIGEDYYGEYECESKMVIKYRSTKTKRKLNGNFIRQTVGQYDSTLQFRLASTFEKGLLSGADSTFRNGNLINVDNYIQGIKNGKQIRFDDSVKIVSTYYDGIIQGKQQTFVNDTLFIETTFLNGIKNGNEFYFDPKGDTLAVFHYKWKKEESPDIFIQDKINRRLAADTSDLRKILPQLDYQGTITFYEKSDPNNVDYIYYRDVIHDSVIDGEDCEKISYGQYYILEKWGGDGLDQIWSDIWLVFKYSFEEGFTYMEIERH